MEPVFDQYGSVVAWLRGEHLLDTAGRHVAVLRRNWLVSYGGAYLGRLYAGWFRDRSGAAVGFIQGALGLPKTPATETPPPPPEPEPTPSPPVVSLFSPAATVPMPIWSYVSWNQFVGRRESAEEGLVTESRFLGRQVRGTPVRM